MEEKGSKELCQNFKATNLYFGAAAVNIWASFSPSNVHSTSHCTSTTAKSTGTEYIKSLKSF